MRKFSVVGELFYRDYVLVRTGRTTTTVVGSFFETRSERTEGNGKWRTLKKWKSAPLSAIVSSFVKEYWFDYLISLFP
jgi:hypothetical protein